MDMDRARSRGVWMLAVGSALAGCLLAAGEAGAIPTFARKEAVSCSACHVAWPLLNGVGREFKESGYRLSEAYKEPEVIAEHLRLEEMLPVSVALESRPYDKQEGSDEKLHALEEASLLTAGTTHEVVSCFVELAAEADMGFEPEIELATVGYHPSPALNVQLSLGPLTQTDAYDTYAGHRRLTVSAYSVTDSPFGGADAGAGLGARRQTLSVYGRPIRSVLYDVGLSGAAEDTEGERPRTFHGRLALNVRDGIAIGVLVIRGRWASDAGERDYGRLGIDTQIEIANLRVAGAYVMATDDVALGPADRARGGQEENTAFYAQALYAFVKDYGPFLVPLVRYDSYTTNDGGDRYGEVTFHLSCYVIQNLRLSAEYWMQADTPGGTEKDSRVTAQMAVAF